jgi:hypothetical protein
MSNIIKDSIDRIFAENASNKHDNYLQIVNNSSLIVNEEEKKELEEYYYFKLEQNIMDEFD